MSVHYVESFTPGCCVAAIMTRYPCVWWRRRLWKKLGILHLLWLVLNATLSFILQSSCDWLADWMISWVTASRREPKIVRKTRCRPEHWAVADKSVTCDASDLSNTGKQRTMNVLATPGLFLSISVDVAINEYSDTVGRDLIVFVEWLIWFDTWQTLIFNAVTCDVAYYIT